MIGTIFLQIGGKFPKMVPLLLPNFTEMVPVLFVIFILFSNSTFFVAKLCRFPKWYLFSGDFFVQIGAKFSQMLPFLLFNFYHFLKCTIFVLFFSHFAQMIPYFVF